MKYSKVIDTLVVCDNYNLCFDFSGDGSVMFPLGLLKSRVMCDSNKSLHSLVRTKFSQIIHRYKTLTINPLKYTLILVRF